MDLNTFDWDVFASIIFMQGNIADGMITTLTLSLVVWIIGLVFGIILSEVKFHIIYPFKLIIDYILWSYKCLPILLLIYYFYYYGSEDGALFSPFFASVMGMSFWAIAYSAERFYCCHLYLKTHQEDNKTSQYILILIPMSLKILIRIIVLSPLVMMIGVPDFFYMAIQQITLTYQSKEILLAAMVVYTIVVGIISIIAKILDILFKTPELVR